MLRPHGTRLQLKAALWLVLPDRKQRGLVLAVAVHRQTVEPAWYYLASSILLLLVKLLMFPFDSVVYRPSLKDVRSFAPHADKSGWPIEHFIADLFVACKEGTPFTKPGEEMIQRLFYRRSGPIAAAISITIEGPPVEQNQ